VKLVVLMLELALLTRPRRVVVEPITPPRRLLLTRLKDTTASERSEEVIRVTTNPVAAAVAAASPEVKAEVKAGRRRKAMVGTEKERKDRNNRLLRVMNPFSSSVCSSWPP
jgi:cbb3-type cytochrome oxidase cytochrome c subunit